MTAPEADGVVRRFVAACAARDVDAALELLTDDVEYDNVPIGEVVGRDAVRSVLTGDLFAAATECEWVILRQVAGADGVVMNERVDRFRVGERWIEIPVAGIFELRDLRIALWRDYFDLADYRRQKHEAFESR